MSPGTFPLILIRETVELMRFIVYCVERGERREGGGDEYMIRKGRERWLC